jgi:predicted enzyme related to lactoylglutathione lyase
MHVSTLTESHVAAYRELMLEAYEVAADAFTSTVEERPRPARNSTQVFASHELGAINLPDGHVKASDFRQPLGMEIALVTADVQSAHRSALAHGGCELSAPTHRPWGQVASHIRAPDGTLVELCTPLIG